MTTSAIQIRRATPDDADSFLQLIDGLAAYEKLEPPDAAAKKRLVRDMAAKNPRFEVYLAEIKDASVGYAIVFETYSTFLALPTLYLEDLFVLPEYRKNGIGNALFRKIAAEARRRGCGRMEWAVLDWNSTAIDFYRKLGATHLKEWNVYRLTNEDLGRISE